jgi:N-acetylneuraminic acid mutarotase
MASKRLKVKKLGIFSPEIAVLVLISCSLQPARAGLWTTTVPLTTGRSSHTTTLLPNGLVLVVGGFNGSTVISSAQLYDPSTGIWSITGSLNTARQSHTATLLPNGKVLVAGGVGTPFAYLNSAEIYDPASGFWTTATGSMSIARAGATATLLPGGKVLVAGGTGSGTGGGGGAYLFSSELYDPATGTWTVTGSLNARRTSHTATLLTNGLVLVAGGTAAGVNLASAELYNPSVGTWATTTTPLIMARQDHTATLLPNGKVLVAGGLNPGALSTAELYDPVAATWSSAGSMSTARYLHEASLLPNGKVLVTGGIDSSGALRTATAELFDPVAGTWASTISMNVGRDLHTSTVLPNGRVLVVSGIANSGATTTAELYDPAINPATGTWTTATGTLNFPRKFFTLTLLPNGKVLAAGGFDTNFLAMTNSELYDPSTTLWTVTGSQNVPRYDHTATLLPNGGVLVAGGYDTTYLASAERYDPVSGTWSLTGSMTTPRIYHTATLLTNGLVLVAGGGSTATNSLASAELFNPATGTWALTGSLNDSRAGATAVLLPNGKVLVAGGIQGNNDISSAELYDPSMGLWTKINPMSTQRIYHSMTLLPNGQVLVAGGENSGGNLASAELYNPATGLWTASTNNYMTTTRDQQLAILLLNGKVLVIGGNTGSPTSDLYDPAQGVWTATGSLNAFRGSYPATLLPSGKVLVAGGGFINLFNSAELYDPGQGFSNSWQPQINSPVPPFLPGSTLALTGAQFRGVSEGSGGGTQNSAADHPVVQLRAIENEQTSYLLVTNWSTNSLVTAPVGSFPIGYAMATVFVNGIPSTSSIVSVAPKTSATVTLGNLSQVYDGAAEAVSVTTLPPGLAVIVTYNGSTNAPTNAGNYAVVATINDPNYQGTATNTLVIAQATAIVTLANLAQSYDGAPKSVSVSTVPSGLDTFVSYNGSFVQPTNAGNYTVVATVFDANYQGSTTNTMFIVNGVSVDTSQTVRTADGRWWGVNAAAWDSYLPSSIPTLQELGTRLMRWPGGSWGDMYHETNPPNVGYGCFTTNFIHVATNVQSQAFMIANYGTGSPQEAADWVRLCNVTNHAGFKYWEIGNECYGSWESDANTNAPWLPHDPWSYAQRFVYYYNQMKAVDPSIKIGVVGVYGEDSYANYTNHFAINPVTGVTHYGWTPVMLSTLNSLGVTPDFLVDHYYPEYITDDDATLLQQASLYWAYDAAQYRQQLSDYLGTNGSNVELVVTEINADAGPPGRQSTSIVDGLFLADSMSQIMKTEFNAFLWFDLRNQSDPMTDGGDWDPSIYGWRTNADHGILLGLTTRYPTFYSMKLMQFFAQPGDTILNAGSSDSLLSTYAAQSTSGAVSLLVINKDPTNSYNRAVALGGFQPNSAAIVRSYGIPQDDAVRTNSVIPGAQDIATNNLSSPSNTFTYTFGPYSLTLFTFSPTPPGLALVAPKSGNNLVFQLYGQRGVRYVLLNSTDLIHWTPTLTNVMAGNTMNITNPIPSAPSQQFWRVAWQP